MHIRRFAVWFLLVAVFFAMPACYLAKPESAATATPDPCTGWDCTLTGTIYQDLAREDNRLIGIPITLWQVSHCSPTAGEHESVSGVDGQFSFDVFLHDTDSFLISVEAENYSPLSLKFGGFDCLYCSCAPMELILESN